MVPSAMNVARELGLLRGVVENLMLLPPPPGTLTLDFMRSHSMGRAKRDDVGVKGLLHSGVEPFTELSEAMFIWSSRIERGTEFSRYQEALFDRLFGAFLGRNPNTLLGSDVVVLHNSLQAWFDESSANRTVFLPCMITPAASPRVEVGPVSFLFMDDVRTSEFYLNKGLSGVEDFEVLLKEMIEEKAHWLAAVEVKDCDSERAHELAALSVDLAIVAFQLAAPYLGTRTMSRLAARRGPAMRHILSLSHGYFSGGFSNAIAGLSIGKGYLGHIVSETAPIITAVGNRVQSFVAGSFRFPNLEQAWCDAAYWLHEGLAEPVDSIAVAKLETSLEILLRAENARGSEGRIISALDTFYGLATNDPISKHTATTAKQFAQRFVRDRSRVLHGTASTLNARLSASRGSLEDVAITLIRACALELDDYANSSMPDDDIDAFLGWIKLRRQSASAV